MPETVYCMLKILCDTLSYVDIDMLVNTLVKRDANVELKSLENTLVKTKKEAPHDNLATRLSEVTDGTPCEALA